MTRSQTRSDAQNAEDLSPFNWRGKPSIFTRDSVPVVVQRKTESQLRREELARRNAEIVKLFSEGRTRREIGNVYGLTPHSIADIIRTSRTTH